MVIYSRGELLTQSACTACLSIVSTAGLLIYCLLYSITILHLLALFMDMKPDNKLCLSHVNTRFGQRILRYKGSQLWNRLPSNLTNSTASQPFRKKTKIVVVLWPDVIYCNEFFLDICHIDYYILNQTVHIV